MHRLLREAAIDPLALGAAGTEDLQRERAEAYCQELFKEIKSRLRHTPFWFRGHRLLAELGIEQRELGIAYAAAQALQVLARSAQDQARAKGLLGICHLRMGSIARAVSILEEATSALPTDAGLLEELAAAYIAGDQKDRAKAILERIPQECLGQQGKIALELFKRPDY